MQKGGGAKVVSVSVGGRVESLVRCTARFRAGWVENACQGATTSTDHSDGCYDALMQCVSPKTHTTNTAYPQSKVEQCSAVQ